MLINDFFCIFISMGEKYIGAHVTTAGGVENSVLHADRIGAAGFAIFTRNQRRWESPDLSMESIRLFRERMAEYGYTADMVLPHNSYLINLAQPDPQKRRKSFDAFMDEINRTEDLGLKYLNFHPGSTVGLISRDEGIERIASSINEAQRLSKTAVLVLETTSGQKNKIGGSFREIADIISLVEDKSRVGVCIDTCHVFAAGYDIRDAAGWNRMMLEFEHEIGLDFLRGLHLNDSEGGLGERIDRHQNIGQGRIGLEAFRAIVNDSRLDALPMVLETPDRGGWEKEIRLLKSLIV